MPPKKPRAASKSMAGRKAAPTKNKVTKTRKASKPPVSAALETAIDILDATSLRHTIKSLNQRYSASLKDLEDQWLVRGREAIRNHEETVSEDDEDSEIEGSEEEDDFDGVKEDELEYEKEERRRVLQLIEVSNEKAVGRHVKYENRGEGFEVVSDDRGDCVWHSGEKELDEDAYIWADHDYRCHGPPDSFIDAPNYAEGFLWSRCENEGDNAGCKSTKHKAGVDIVRGRA